MLKTLQSSALRLFILISAFSSSVQAGGIDCKKAATPMDKLICGSSEVLKVDEAMGTLFQEKLDGQILEKRSELIEKQKAWLKTRDACLPKGAPSPAAASVVDCVIKAYQARMTELGMLVADSRASHCYAPWFEGAPFQVGTLAPQAGEVFLLECPKPEDKSCRSNIGIKPTDSLIVSRKYKDWGCAAVLRNVKGRDGVRGYLTNWVPLEKLTLQKPKLDPPVSAWVGEWLDGYYNTMVLKPDPGGLSFEGMAQYRNPFQVGTGEDKDGDGKEDMRDEVSIHVGEMYGTARPKGNRLQVGQGPDDCQINLTLVGEFLIALDNNLCGGANVSFNGIYVRTK